MLAQYSTSIPPENGVWKWNIRLKWVNQSFIQTKLTLQNQTSADVLYETYLLEVVARFLECFLLHSGIDFKYICIYIYKPFVQIDTVLGRSCKFDLKSFFSLVAGCKLNVNKSVWIALGRLQNVLCTLIYVLCPGVLWF